MSCKGCTPSLSNFEVKRLVKEQLEMERDLVDDKTYDDRIRECNNCPSLLSDTTCAHCGCYVEFRARLSYKACPYPEGARW
ncbi:DUF6171 family protein [Radiobacillus kanasensis]|uniref:DUF6171 family protein n=1 Tax=Radiobacillus kanasensis TaxID=2844358 RepID=UPI001E31BF3A|nr:DUF6171 family protein [Radiobacillus kanasensis]UFT99768.1 DUF6171 family protein [Radiobacillus kanasensis]